MPNVTMTNSEGERVIYINQSIPVGTFNSDELVNAELLRLGQVFWKTKGPQISGKLQGTHAENPAAADWFDLQNISAGLNSTTEICVKRLRVQLVQGGASAQPNELSVFGTT